MVTKLRADEKSVSQEHAVMVPDYSPRSNVRVQIPWTCVDGSSIEILVSLVGGI